MCILHIILPQLVQISCMYMYDHREPTGGCQANVTLSGKTCLTTKSLGGPGTSRTLTKPEASQIPELLSRRNVYFPVSRNRSLLGTVKIAFRSVQVPFLEYSSSVSVSGSWHNGLSFLNHVLLGAGSPPNHKSKQNDRPFLTVISCIPGCLTKGSTVDVIINVNINNCF